MFNPLKRNCPVCPECKRPLLIRRGRCCKCGVEVHLPVAYFRLLWFLTFLVLAGIGSVVFHSQHIGTWLFLLIIVSIPVRIAWGFVIPPWIERGEYKSGWPFGFFYLAVFMTLFLEWIAWGWLHVGLGATRAELSENWFFFSIPLCWISSNFLIRSDRWLSDAVGSILGNSFFYALFAFALYRAVSSVLDRNRAIRLNITDPEEKN